MGSTARRIFTGACAVSTRLKPGARGARVPCRSIPPVCHTAVYGWVLRRGVGKRVGLGWAGSGRGEGGWRRGTSCDMSVAVMHRDLGLTLHLKTPSDG